MLKAGGKATDDIIDCKAKAAAVLDIRGGTQRVLLERGKLRSEISLP